MEIGIAATDDEVRACYAVMVQLRPELTEAGFVERIRALGQGGYRLARLEDGGMVRAVAGFRIGDMLHRGRHVYVDDLVTAADARSRGYGDALFDWLVEHARENGCVQFHLDSGVQRFDAHRFYFRKRMRISAYHFAMEL